MSYQRQFYGLINIGNSCYLNATLQSLANLYPLAKLFLTEEFRNDIKNNNYFILEFYNFLKILWSNEICLIKPVKLKSYLSNYDKKFNNSNQQDAHETLIILLDMLHKGLSYHASINFNGTAKNSLDKLMINSIKNWKNEYEKEYSKIIELFHGQFITKLLCLNCHNITYIFESFISLCLPIESTNTNIDELLDNFFKVENINDYQCEKCKNKNVQKKISLWRLPQIFIITFKRFNNHLIKYNQVINFSLDNINLNKYLSGYEKNVNYTPVSLINHIGSLNSGHYYAFCKKGNEWYNCDDSNTIKLNDVSLNHVYIIFLIKK